MARDVSEIRTEKVMKSSKLREVNNDIAGWKRAIEDLETRIVEVRSKIEIEDRTRLELEAEISKLNDEEEGVGQDEADFEGCPHEWQKKAINFLRKHPGVSFHFTALIAAVKDDMIGKAQIAKITKLRSDMLNLMSHLIVGGKVEKLKDGNYKWIVFPKNWQAAPAPVIPLTMKFVGKLDTAREETAARLLSVILGKNTSPNGQLQSFIEKEFHDSLVKQGVSDSDDYKDDAQFIENYIYSRAQVPSGEFSVFKKREQFRAGSEPSVHTIMRRTNRQYLGNMWEEVSQPVMRPTPLDTKRKGGSVA